MIDRLVEIGYAAGWRTVRVLPAQVSSRTFRAAADFATRRGGKGVTRLAANLRRVIGPERSEAELNSLVRQGMRSYLRYYQEAFRLPSRSREQLRTDFALAGDDWLADDIGTGRGAIVALPHGGNWDAAGAWAAAHDWPITTVAERLRPESLYRRFLAFREGLGMEILPASGGRGSTVDALADRLKKGALVPLLADRDLSARGVEVTFFGGRTRMPAGPALLALRTGSPLYTCDMWYEPAGPRGALRGPLPLPGKGTLDQRVRSLTQLVADWLAEGIAAHPGDWHMLQRLWLADLPAAPAAQPAG